MKTSRPHTKARIAALAMAAILCLTALPLAASGAGDISYQEAVRIALAKYRNSKPIHCDRDNDDGVSVYNVEVVNKTNKRVYDVHVRASNGKIVHTEYEGKLEGGRSPSDITVGYSTAITKARSKASGGKYLGFDVEWRNGAARYEVDFRMKDGRERTVHVNAKSCAVIRVDHHNDSDDDHDDGHGDGHGDHYDD